MDVYGSGNDVQCAEEITECEENRDTVIMANGINPVLLLIISIAILIN